MYGASHVHWPSRVKCENPVSNAGRQTRCDAMAVMAVQYSRETAVLAERAQFKHPNPKLGNQNSGRILTGIGRTVSGRE